MLNRTRVFGLGLGAIAGGVAATAIAVLAMIMASPADATDPNALWRVVHDLCVTDMKARGAPAPCVAVDLTRGYAILKDLRGATQLLLIPTDRIGGIESPQLLALEAPNYWQAAWEARALFEKRVGHPVPRDDIGLAINSIYGRSQNQLHIHIDCVQPDVRQALEANEARIGHRWSSLDVPLHGHAYHVRRIEGSDLGARDPFKLLAEGDPRARGDMGRETLAVIGASFADGQPGFVLLSDHADLLNADRGASEELLDHSCAVLTEPGPAPAGVAKPNS
jgi:CDP-diacylglycerol pyrophosphatase